MADNDFYQTLGVAKGASKEEIRKAYRKLARESHPDAKPNDPQAAARFKEIQEAYDVLSDEKKRELYDRFGKNYEQAARAGAAGGGGNPFGGANPFAGGSPVDFADLFGQGGIDLGEFFGANRASGKGRRTQLRGEDVRATVRVPFETAVTGGSVDVVIDKGGTSETLGVKVPVGVNEGQVIRLSGQGGPGRNGPAGDLYLTIEIAPHAYFRREANNLVVDVPVTPAEAVLGAKIDVPTMTEGHVVMTVPPGTSSGMKLRLRGKGIRDSQSGQVGDQFAVIKIVVPKDTSEADKALYRKLAEHDSNPRAKLWQ